MPVPLGCKTEARDHRGAESLAPVKGVLREKTRLDLVEGTLNVRLDAPYIVIPDFVLEASEQGITRRSRSKAYLATEAPLPSHMWIINKDGRGDARRLTQGTEGVSLYVGTSIAWSPDGSTLAHASQAEPIRDIRPACRSGSSAWPPENPGCSLRDGHRLSRRRHQARPRGRP